MDVEVLKPSATHHDPLEYRMKAREFYRQGFDTFGDECTRIANELEREARERQLKDAAFAVMVLVGASITLYSYFVK